MYEVLIDELVIKDDFKRIDLGPCLLTL